MEEQSVKSLNERDSMIHDRNLQIIQLEKESQRLTDEYSQTIQKLTDELNHLKTEIHHINMSFSWRVINKIRRILLPENSIRRKIYLSFRSNSDK